MSGRPSDRQINSDLMRPLLHTSWRFYLLVLVFGGIVLAGVGAWFYQAYNGYGVTGIRWPVYWGFYITSFVFWIGISHAGTLISAILRLVQAEWRRPVTRCAEVITVFALMIGALFPIIHLGRPWLFFWLAPYPSERHDLAQLPLAAGVGLLRHQHLSDRQRPVPAAADDPGLRRGARQVHAACARRSTASWRWAGAARRSSGTGWRRRCRSWRS